MLEELWKTYFEQQPQLVKVITPDGAPLRESVLHAVDVAFPDTREWFVE